jgi:hypothetical protein
MLDSGEKAKILKDILESPEFKDSRRYRELLEYLCRETLAGTTPKELTIGTDFFHKDASFDPKEDPTVRVYLNNLRKKLDHYYLTTETPFSYKLDIPKGRYQVEFVKIDRKAPEPPEKQRISPWIIAGVSLLLLTVGYFLHDLTRGKSPTPQAFNPIWEEYIRPGGRPTLILLGDFYFLYERTPDGKNRNIVRNININSPDDLKEIVKQDPGFSTRFVQCDFTFLRPSASWGLSQILPVLQNSPNGYSIKLASKFTADDLKSNNIVFLGSVKTLYSLRKLLAGLDIDYHFSPSYFSILGHGSDSGKTFSPLGIQGGELEEDYAVAAKGPGPDGSTLMLLMGFSDSGVIEASRAVTEAGTVDSILTAMARRPLPHPFNFTLVVHTKGYNQAISSHTISYFVQK